MHTTTGTPSSVSSPLARPGRFRWRVVDIVVASVIGVAAGLIFWIWNLVYSPITGPLEFVAPGAQALLYGVWLFAGVLGGLIIRKPGAAVYTELVAAVVSALVGTQWGGALTILSGLAQGLGAEIVFALFLYGNYRAYVAVLAGAGAGVGMVVNDLLTWYPGYAVEFKVVYAIAGVISGAVVAGLLSFLLMRGLARTGALSRFAAGRGVAARA